MMAAPDPPGVEITVKHYDFVTLYLACKVPKGEEAKKQEVAAQQLDQLCRTFSGERFPFEPTIGQLVGVYLQNGPSGEWVRGRIEDCLQLVGGNEYRILLIDRGQYVKAKRVYLVQLNEPMKKTPPAYKRIGLYGVLPEASLNQNTRLFLTDFFHRGLMYFKKKEKIESIFFGDIYVQQESDGKIVSLTGHLLANGVVKKVENFEQEARKFYSAIEGMEKCEETSSAQKQKQQPIVDKTTHSEENEELHPPQSSVRNDEDLKNEKRNQSRDTGYSSSDDASSDGPFVRDDVVFFPAGFHEQQTKNKDKSRTKKDEVKPIKNHFQLMKEREKNSRKRTTSSTRSKEEGKSTNQDESKIVRSESVLKKQRVNQNQGTKFQLEEEMDCGDYQEVFKPRKVSFGEFNTREKKDGAVPVGEGKVSARRAFDLNYKSRVDYSDKAILESEVKVETTKDQNVDSKEDRKENLESTQSSINSLDSSNVDTSIELSSVSPFSRVSNDSAVPNDISNTSTLSKKQIISQKLKAGLAALEIVTSHTKEQNDESKENRKENLESTQSSINSLDSSNVNTSIELNSASPFSRVSNDSAVPNDISNSSTLSKKQLISQKLKSGLAALEIVTSHTKEQNDESKEDRKDNLESTQSSINSLDSSNVNTSIELNSASPFSRVSNDSAVSNNISNTSTLSKKQRISQKLKAGLAAMEIVTSHTKEQNVESKETRKDNLESTQGSINSLDSSNVDTSIELNSVSPFSRVSNDSAVPNDISNTSTLSKKPLISQKLKSGLAAQEIAKSLTKEQNVESKEDRKDNLELTQSSINSPDSSNVNKSIELSSSSPFSRVSNDSAVSNNISNTSTLSKKQRISQKLKAGLAAMEIVTSHTKEQNVESKETRKDNLESTQSSINSLDSSNVNTSIELNSVSPFSRVSNDSAVPNDISNTSTLSKKQLISQKLKARYGVANEGEKLRKEKEAEMGTDSEVSQRDLSSSCSQSVCSEDSFESMSKSVEKRILESINSMSIEEVEDDEESFDYFEATDSQSLVRCINTSAGVLIHTKDKRVIRPANTLADCHLDGNIIQTLERHGKREMNRIQKFSFPTIIARRNIAMISPRRSGKTCGYVVPIASNLLSEHFYSKLPRGNGPRALVITPCWESGAFTASEFKKTSPFNSVIHCYGGGAELELKIELLQGCDVLVTTPRCILRLLDYGLTNLNRLCHFVMDDADVLFDKFRSEMQKLMLAIDSAEEKRECRGLNMQLQVVLTARMWTAPLEELVTRILANPTICIASQLEACVYAGIKPSAVFVQNDKKIEKLVGILKEVEGRHRTVVMCRSKEDVKYVHRILIDLGIKNVIAAHEDLTSVNLSEVPGFWNNNQNICEKVWNECPSLPIMIRSDEVLENVPVENASVLIHYNLSSSKKTFSLRFICLMENYRNILRKEIPKQKPQVVILLDETNDLEVPGIMEFMERLGTVLPEPVLQTLEKIEKMNDDKRMTEPLCDDVKEFGECWDVKSCSFRHLVTAELDFPHNVPRTGWVKLVVQHIHDAGHYSARLLEHADKKDQWKRLPTNLLALPIKLINYYATESNKRLHGRPAVGDMVALETARGVFQRAAILKIVEFNKYNEPVRVYLRLVDNGRYDYALVSRMWYLPKELASPPPSAVDVYLCGLRPKDLDVSWPPAPGLWVDQQLREVRQNSPDGYLMGKIAFALNGSLWLEPIEYLEFLPNMATTVYLLNLRKDLLQTNNATENHNHIPALRRLCEKAGLDLPPEQKVQYKKPAQPRPQWAWLPQDHYESVHIVVVQDPNAIFLRINYFADSLQKLVAEIQTYARTQKKGYDCKELLETGDVCLGKPPGFDEWNRAVIKSRPAEDMVELFFVDYGDTEVISWSNVMPISNKLITQLPFQVIECYLAGVKFLLPASKNKELEDEVIDMIYNLSRNEQEEALNLTVKNDADVSDDTSEGSALSLPRPAGSLPGTSGSQLQLPSPHNEDSLSCTSDTISSSRKSSTLSLYPEKNEKGDISHLEPLATSSPGSDLKVLSPVNPSSSQLQGTGLSDSSSASSTRITGIANSFKDLISPNFLGSSQSPVTRISSTLNLVEKVSPFLKRVPTPENAACDDLDDNDLDNTISELNGNSNPKISESNKTNANQSTEVKPDLKENAEEKKSPCQRWVECVIPDSDEDLSFITQNSMTDRRVAETAADLETRTPLVEWHQDDNFVFIHIKLPALTEYNMSSDITSLHFSAVYGGVPYQVDLPVLFGGHKSERAQGTAKACYFEIRLEKLLKGKRKNWPRLTKSDEKFHWLKLNAEKACEGLTDSEDEDVKRLALSLPLWNENPAADSESIASSDRSELVNSELSL